MNNDVKLCRESYVFGQGSSSMVFCGGRLPSINIMSKKACSSYHLSLRFINCNSLSLMSH